MQDGTLVPLQLTALQHMDMSGLGEGKFCFAGRPDLLCCCEHVHCLSNGHATC